MKGDILKNVMKDKRSVVATFNSLSDAVYMVAPDDYKSYIQDMKTLYENIASSDGHSKEYKALVNAVKDAANIDITAKGLTPERIKTMFKSANMKLIGAADDYIKGKEKVRRSKEGSACFDNTLDAVAIVNKYAKGTNYQTKKQLDKINRIRNKNNPNAANYINPDTFVEKYGAQNAKRANEERLGREKANRIRRQRSSKASVNIPRTVTKK